MSKLSKSEKFKIELIDHSESDNYEDALLEWTFIETFYSEGNCICSQGIHENCIIQNTLNNNSLTVGNSCVKKLMNVLYETNNIGKLQSLNTKIRKNELDFKKLDDLYNIRNVNYITDNEYNKLNDFTIRATNNRLISHEMFEETFEIYKKLQQKAQPLVSEEECEKGFDDLWGHLTLIKQEELEEVEYQEMLLRNQEMILRKQEESKRLEYIDKCNFIINHKKLTKNPNFNFTWVQRYKFLLESGNMNIKFESIDNVIERFKL